MKTVISAKLKLNTMPEQFAQLRATQLAYRDALNFVSKYAFEHGKMSNAVGLQDGTYDEIRARFRLPSQMACSVPRQVGATYKGLWTKVKQNAEHRKSGHTKKRYKGLDQAPKYLSPTVTYQYKKDYSFKTDARVSVLTLWLCGRRSGGTLGAQIDSIGLASLPINAYRDLPLASGGHSCRHRF